MMKIQCLTGENVDGLRPLYERFSACAQTDYQWSEAPVDFETVRWTIRNGWLSGYQLIENGAMESTGLMLYRHEAHRAVEINLIHLEHGLEREYGKAALDCLLPRFIQDIRETDGWDVVSYAMLGRQARFIRSITWYGFKPIGQCVLKFDLLDTISLQILKRQLVALPDSEYEIVFWKPELADGVALSIYEAFHQAADALWDPRFRTQDGCRSVLQLLVQGLMGELRPECTPILLRKGVPVGFCFLLQTGATTGNIPLIGVCPEEKGRGLGPLLLQRALTGVLEETLAGRLNLFSVDATTDTDNTAAIVMYRRLGFREEHHYPHVYLDREQALAFRPGQWC